METKTPVVTGITKHEDKLFTSLRKQDYSTMHERTADALPPCCGGDRKRCKPDRSRAEPLGLDPKARERGITCDARIRSFRDEGKHKLLVGTQTIDEIGLRRTSEGFRKNCTNRQGVGTLLEPQFVRWRCTHVMRAACRAGPGIHAGIHPLSSPDARHAATRADARPPPRTQSRADRPRQCRAHRYLCPWCCAGP